MFKRYIYDFYDLFLQRFRHLYILFILVLLNFKAFHKSIYFYSIFALIVYLMLLYMMNIIILKHSLYVFIAELECIDYHKNRQKS